MELYCNCLEEIKLRMSTVRRMVKGEYSLGRDDFDAEFASIQMRKTIELIAFSSLVANKEIYSKEYENYSKTWNPKYLIKDLERINPNFYPVPMFITPQEDPSSVKNLDFVKGGYLTKEEFVFLYDKMGKALHARNPFQSGENILNLKRSISEWIDRITTLLWLHRVKMVNRESFWVVFLQRPDDGKAHVLLSEPME